MHTSFFLHRKGCQTLFLVDELYFLGITRFGIRCLIGIAEGYAVQQFVAFAEVQFLQILGCFGRFHKAGRSAQTARSDAHGLCRKYHVAAQQTAVYLRAVVRRVVGDKYYRGGIAKHVLERRIFSSFRICFLVELRYTVDKLRIVHYAYFPRLFIHAIGSIDATFQDGLHGVAVHRLWFVLADAAAIHNGFDDSFRLAEAFRSGSALFLRRRGGASDGCTQAESAHDTFQ